MDRKTNVPFQAEGYFLQETRFLFHLLNSEPGDAVFLEYFGDVATQKADNTIISEEDKSSKAANPLSNRSVNLWKTLYNWVMSVGNGVLQIDKTFFRIYVPNQFPLGNFIGLLHNATSIAEARKALSQIKKEMWGDYPKYSLKSEIADSIYDYVESVLSNEEITEKIIERFKIEQGERLGYQEVETKLQQIVIPTEHIQDFKYHILGWIKNTIDTCIGNDEPAKVTFNEYKREADSFMRKLLREGILNSIAKPPTTEEAENQIGASPIYIRQLVHIDQNYNELFSAVNDFLMADVDRYEWIERGLINEKSANEFEKNLISTWKNVSGEIINLYSGKSKKNQGAAIYYRCKQHKTEIERNTLPPHFVPGTYHLLSNKLELGWHPEWLELCCIDEEDIDHARSE